MVMSSQTKDLICAMLTIPVAEKLLQSATGDKDNERQYRRIVEAYFSLREEFERTYDQR